jgi:hypothetical protein
MVDGLREDNFFLPIKFLAKSHYGFVQGGRPLYGRRGNDRYAVTEDKDAAGVQNAATSK